MARFDTNLIH